MKIHFIRHAEANYDLEKESGEFPGVSLTKRGRQQSQRLSSELCSFNYDHVFCSDMSRAIETIQPSLQHLSKEPVYDSRLREISDATTSNHDNNWFSESKEEQIQRIESFLTFLKTLKGEILIIAHFGVIRYISKKLGNEIVSPAYARHYILKF